MDHYSTSARSVVFPEASPADLQPILRIFCSVVVLAIAAGLLGIVSLPMALLRAHQGSLTGFADIPLFVESSISPSHDFYLQMLSGFLGTGLSALLFISSVAALRFKRIARPFLLLWAIATLLYDIPGSLVFARWIFGSQAPLAQVRGDIDTLVVLAGWAISLPLAVAMLYLLTRRAVKRALVE